MNTDDLGDTDVGGIGGGDCGAFACDSVFFETAKGASGGVFDPPLEKSHSGFASERAVPEVAAESVAVLATDYSGVDLAGAGAASFDGDGFGGSETGDPD